MYKYTYVKIDSNHNAIQALIRKFAQFYTYVPDEENLKYSLLYSFNGYFIFCIRHSHGSSYFY
ncbi:hypothetical protein T190607A02C_70056 [Tenacibaculum sp. 190524A02b]